LQGSRTVLVEYICQRIQVRVEELGLGPEGEASELRERLAEGESATALATEYGVSRQAIYNYKIA
jgi:hypothetical protein